MSRVYQVAELLIRGTVASQTMTKRLAELPKEELASFNTFYEKVLDSEELKSAQSRLIRELRNTIGCEYAESSAAAKQEFRIVVWRALVNVMYHHEYSFRCKHCKATSYTAKSGRTTPINREMSVCPACACVEISTATGLIYCPSHMASHLPQSSPIEAIMGEPKLTKEEVFELTTNPKALAKWVREFTTGYTRQVLRENKIKYECKRITETNFADVACKRELIGLLDAYNIRYSTVASSAIIHTEKSLELSPVKFTADFCALRSKYEQYEVVIDNMGVVPTTVLHIIAPAITPMVTTVVTSYAPILILNQPMNGSIDDDDNTDTYTIERRKYSLDGKCRVSSDNPTMRTENTEMLEVIRDNLGDGIPRWVFDSVTQGLYVPVSERAAWDEFAIAHADELNDIMRNGGTEINNKKVAALLGISTRTVQEVIGQMRVIGIMLCGYNPGEIEQTYD